MFGQRAYGNQTGSYTPASADGAPKYKVAGITVAWGTVPANATQTTLIDGNVAPAGTKYIPFGAVMSQITAAGATQGQYGPYDPAAADGRQNLVRGRCVIMNYTTFQDDNDASHPPAAFEGGRVFEERIKIVTGGAYVPGWTPAVAAAFPLISLAGGF